MSDPEQRLDQLGKCVFLGMKNAFLIGFDTPSTCGGALHSWDDWASHVVFKNG